jgi:nucleoside-diphosphate-sugar epimerase
MKFLVTGATGFLGSSITRSLVGRGHAVRVLVRSTSDRSRIADLPLEEAAGDVRDTESLRRAVKGVDSVIHSAALVSARSEREFDAANAAGTKNLVAAMAESAADARLVYISSQAAAGPSSDGTPRSEAMPPAPVSHYGRSKLRGEEFVREWDGERGQAIVLRPPVVYGPGDLKLLALFRLTRWRLAPLIAGGRNTVAAIYIDDAVDAVVRAAESEVGGRTYFVSDGASYSWREVCAAVEEAIGVRALRVPVPHWGLVTAALAAETFGLVRGTPAPLSRQKVIEMTQRHWTCSTEAFKADFNWEPRVDLRTGARRAVDWYRTQGLL